MSSHRQTLAESILARISRGAVPVDGIYWFDPREAAKAKAERSAQIARPPARATRPVEQAIHPIEAGLVARK